MKKKKSKSGAAKTKGKDAHHFPKGWDARSIKALADHYDNQSPEAAAAEDDAAYRSTLITMMAIPVELVPQVHKLLAKRAG